MLSKLQRKALADPEIMLGKLVQAAKSMELSEVQAANQLTKNTTRREINQDRNESQPKANRKRRFCSFQRVLGKNNCPAFGKQCRRCQK